MLIVYFKAAVSHFSKKVALLRKARHKLKNMNQFMVAILNDSKRVYVLRGDMRDLCSQGRVYDRRVIPILLESVY